MSRKRKARVHLPTEYSDPTPERLRMASGALHDSWKQPGARPTSVRTITFRDSMLEKLIDRNLVTERQYYVGARFREYWTRCQASGSVASVDLEAVLHSIPCQRVGGFRAGIERDKLVRAWKGLGGELYRVVEQVVCYDHSLRYMATVLGGAPNGRGVKRAKDLLLRGLDGLVELWG